MKLTKEGKKDYIRQIEVKEKELKELRIRKGKESVEQGNVWHDNFDFEQTELQERNLMKLIEDMRKNLQEVELIEENCNDEDVVKVGDTVLIRLTSSGESEEMIITLSGKFNSKEEDEVSVDSPLGRCIFNQKQGFKGSYSVSGYQTNIEIIEIEK